MKLTPFLAFEIGVKHKTPRIDPFNSTMRTLGSASLSAVASAMALGSFTSLRTASPSSFQTVRNGSWRLSNIVIGVLLNMFFRFFLKPRTLYKTMPRRFQNKSVGALATALIGAWLSGCAPTPQARTFVDDFQRGLVAYERGDFTRARLLAAAGG